MFTNTNKPAKPAFILHRFKKSIVIVTNEEMGEVLHDLLLDNEEQKESVPTYLYEFTSQLGRALQQPPPGAHYGTDSQDRVVPSTALEK